MLCLVSYNKFIYLFVYGNLSFYILFLYIPRYKVMRKSIEMHINNTYDKYNFTF